jgi:hypothetical protein
MKPVRSEKCWELALGADHQKVVHEFVLRFLAENDDLLQLSPALERKLRRLFRVEDLEIAEEATP